MNVDTGTFAAITDQVSSLAAEVAELRSQLADVARVEAILRRADAPASAAPSATVRQRRPRHLTVAGGGQR